MSSLSRVSRRRSLPLVLLAVVSLLSLGARVTLLGSPCRAPCDKATDHVLVFDEAYYVNAARVIAGIAPPPGAHYAGSPFGDDPNSEHPQLAKLVMAGSIELFGDGPLAWRLGSIVLGSVAILGMYFLVRSAGGGPWPALGAATLMAVDNLALVHSRIGTLDIYAVTAMIFGAALYLRRRPLLAGVVIGVGACTKFVAPYVLLSLLLLELLGVIRPAAIGTRVKRFAACAVATAGPLLGPPAADLDRTVHCRCLRGYRRPVAGARSGHGTQHGPGRGRRFAAGERPPARPPPGRPAGGQVSTRLVNLRIAAQASSAVPPTSTDRKAQAGMCPTCGVSAARSPSLAYTMGLTSTAICSQRML